MRSTACRKFFGGIVCDQWLAAKFLEVLIAINGLPQNSWRYCLRSMACRKIFEGIDCDQQPFTSYSIQNPTDYLESHSIIRQPTVCIAEGGCRLICKECTCSSGLSVPFHRYIFKRMGKQYCSFLVECVYGYAHRLLVCCQEASRDTVRSRRSLPW